MNTDSSLLLLLADLRGRIADLDADNAALREQAQALRLDTEGRATHEELAEVRTEMEWLREQLSIAQEALVQTEPAGARAAEPSATTD